MREIIFRGKVEKDGSWITGNLITTTYHDTHGNPKTYYAIQSMDICLDEDGFAMSQSGVSDNVILETVGQYTGFTDKNGVKIFEGDILIINGNAEMPAFVKYDGAEIVCVSSNPKLMYWKHRLENDSTKYEVVGNIYDNPELLEG